MTWKDWEPWENLYKKWTERISETKINLTWPSLKGLWQWFVRETESRGIDVETIDVEALLDPSLTYQENKQILLEEMKSPLTDTEYEGMYAEYKNQLLDEVAHKYPEVMDPLMDRIAELERIADKKAKYQKLVKTLRWELEETKRRLEELQKRPPPERLVKLRALKPIEMGIFRYRTGEEFETADVEWARKLVTEGSAAEVPLVPVVIPPPPAVPALPPKKEAKVKVRVEGQREADEYIARMLFDTFEAGFTGFRSTRQLEEWLRRGVDVVDWRENLRAAGFSPEEIEEELKRFPEPFREGVPVRVFWKFPEDVVFDELGQKYWNIAHPPKPPVPITPFRGLTKAEEDRIEMKFWALLAEKGITPAVARGRNYYAMFKDRVETWKVELKDTERTEAVRQVLEKLLPDLIEVIQGLERERALLPRVIPIPPERIIRIGVPPERPMAPEMPPEMFVYPVEKPKKPISPAAFPRSPTSEERAVLWDWFKYEMARLRQDPYRWRDVFQKRLNIPYRTWEGMMKTFQEFIADVEAGRELALIPLLRIPMPWEETKGTEKWRRDAIIHFVATKLYATMEDLIEALAEWGVYPKVTPEEVKEAVKEAWKTKDIWFLSVPKEFVDTLLGEDVEA